MMHGQTKIKLTIVWLLPSPAHPNSPCLLHTSDRRLQCKSLPFTACFFTLTRPLLCPPPS